LGQVGFAFASSDELSDSDTLIEELDSCVALSSPSSETLVVVLITLSSSSSLTTGIGVVLLIFMPDISDLDIALPFKWVDEWPGEIIEK
jgi:hypothetical protein